MFLFNITSLLYMNLIEIVLWWHNADFRSGNITNVTYVYLICILFLNSVAVQLIGFLMCSAAVEWDRCPTWFYFRGLVAPYMRSPRWTPHQGEPLTPSITSAWWGATGNYTPLAILAKRRSQLQVNIFIIITQSIYTLCDLNLWNFI